MSEWNVEMVREECLKLMGWEYIGHLAAWRSPSGVLTSTEAIALAQFDVVPNPTTSLDDALPLFKANDGTFIWLGLTEDGEEFEAQHGAWRQVNKNPALAVCLLRLELEGRNLDDFRVKP